jgi:dihydroneopterin aldolase
MKENVSGNFHSLKISELSIQVHLGCGLPERSKLQEIRVSIELQFHSAPVAEQSDRLEDTLCYAQLSEAFRKHCESREFALIEKLTADLFQITRQLTGTSARASVTVHKVAPPVAGLIGGATYRIADFA